MMLVAAVAIMGAGLLAWSNSSFTISKQNIANTTNSKINMINEYWIIEDVWFYKQGPTNYANVTIRNTGAVAIKVAYIYVNNTQVWPTTAGTVKLVNATKSAVIQTTFNWGPNDAQNIWVKTSRDSQVKQVWKSS